MNYVQIRAQNTGAALAMTVGSLVRKPERRMRDYAVGRKVKPCWRTPHLQRAATGARIHGNIQKIKSGVVACLIFPR